MSKDDPFNLESLTTAADLIARQRKIGMGPKPKRPRLDGQFILVPFEAVQLFSPRGRVVLQLLYLAWWHRSRTVVLANRKLGEWGVSRYQKYRALENLERAGLISVERRVAKNPRVTLLG
jgi:hypothetical protein